MIARAGDVNQVYWVRVLGGRGRRLDKLHLCMVVWRANRGVQMESDLTSRAGLGF
jgi:hypothetical protein